MQNLGLEIIDKARLDAIALGALVIRLDSGDKPFRYADEVLLHVSGAEYNPIAAISEYGLKTAIVTAMGTGKDSDKVRKVLQSVGDEGVKILGVEVKSTPYTGHHSLTFSDTPRGSARNTVDYNRAGGLDRAIEPGMLDIDLIFDGGVRWFHSGGIYAASAPHNPDVIVELFKAAKERKTITSYDLNFRELLWGPHGEQAAAIRASEMILPHVDVMVGNETDTGNAAGIEAKVEGKDEFDPGPFKEVEQEVRRRYPNIKIIVTSLRHEYDNERHDWGAIASFGGDIVQVPKELISVNDRIGGGDSLAAGVITAALKGGYSPQETLNLGWASGKMGASYRGDRSLATWPEVLAIAAGDIKVKR